MSREVHMRLIFARASIRIPRLYCFSCERLTNRVCFLLLDLRSGSALLLNKMAEARHFPQFSSFWGKSGLLKGTYSSGRTTGACLSQAKPFQIVAFAKSLGSCWLTSKRRSKYLGASPGEVFLSRKIIVFAAAAITPSFVFCFRLSGRVYHIDSRLQSKSMCGDVVAT